MNLPKIDARRMAERDRLIEARRKLPMIKVEKEYVLTGRKAL